MNARPRALLVRASSLRRDQAGSVAVLTLVIVSVAVLFLTGIVDAGAGLRAASKADVYAAEAARAASIAMGPGSNGGPGAAGRAAAAARTYLQQAGATGTVTITGPSSVSVTVTVTQSSPILGIAISKTRTHEAQLLAGVTSGGNP